MGTPRPIRAKRWAYRTGSILAATVTSLYGILAIALCTIVLVVKYAIHKQVLELPFYRTDNPIATAVAVLAVAACCALAIWRATSNKQPARKLHWPTAICTKPLLCTALASVLVFAVQVLIIVSIQYMLRWDPGFMLDYAKDAAQGKDLSQYRWYFNTYPNNVYFEGYMVAITKFALFIRINPAMLLASIGALCVTIAGQLSAAAVQELLHKPMATYALFGVYTVLISLSSWVSVPYTDTYLTVFVAAAVLCYIKSIHASRPVVSALYFAGAALAIALGSMCKPTIWVFAVALVLSELLRILLRLRTAKRVLANLGILVVLSALWVGAAMPALQRAIDIPVDKQDSFSYTHYLMMGINPQQYGVFNTHDVDFSASHGTVKAREQADLQLARQRFDNMSPRELVSFYVKKLSMTFSDGTFGTGREAGGEFPVPEQYRYPNPLGSVSETLRNVFYFGPHRHSMLRLAEQCVWFTVLIGLLFAALKPHWYKSERDRNNQTAILTFLRLCMLGVTLFLMLFETRSRYLYSFSPIILDLAVYGLYQFCSRCAQLSKRWKERRSEHQQSRESVPHPANAR